MPPILLATRTLMSKAHQRANFGTLGREALDRLSNDNDIKIIIQGANSQTGVGKTTLAIELCRFIDRHGWSADNKAFIDIQKYLNSYLDYAGGSALLLDEIGTGADSRRSTSKDNVQLSQGWQMLRARNVATVATLPSTSMLDKRMLELADYWVLVKKRGIAQPYEIRVNDFTGTVARKPFPGDEHIRFPDLPDNDDDKDFLDNIKDDKVRDGGMRSVPLPEHKEKLKNAKQAATRKQRDAMLRDVYRNSELSYSDIASFDSVELGKERVGQIIRGE